MEFIFEVFRVLFLLALVVLVVGFIVAVTLFGKRVGDSFDGRDSK